MHTVLIVLRNFLYSGLELKFMVLSMDAHTHHYVKSRGIISYHYSHLHTSVDNSSVGEGMTGFRSSAFNHISRNKKKGVSDILELGYDVLFSDGDVAIVRDPIQYLRYQNVDYVHSVNVLCP